MKKCFDKSPLTFAVLCIIVYVLALGNGDSISEAMGQPKLITALMGALLTAVLLIFIRKNGLQTYCGLCPFRGNLKGFLYFIPLALLSTVNLWCGVTFTLPVQTALLTVSSMVFVGFLEEVIFRGFLFNAMKKDGLKTAIIVSSLTFGAGHIVNLFMGEPLLDTLLQLVYASAAGLMFTVIFLKSGTLIPCILAHALLNSLTIFLPEMTMEQHLLISGLHTALCLLYTAWVWKKA
ncbi:MAG: CPBP family intramembrane metalloprotease [Clostridia bacterium]|nr:CPBP family intramembrane metalloprotease [Clostridia bacterium]